VIPLFLACVALMTGIAALAYRAITQAASETGRRT
jgi:hypothetical protein